MTDKLVTHDDLSVLRTIRDSPMVGGWTQAERDLMSRLIAAAEADQPPLPEGWVLVPYPDGSHGVWWYSGHGDRLTRYDDGGGGTIDMASVDIRHKVTPLRPTVTEADLKRAAKAAYEVEPMRTWEALMPPAQEDYRRFVRAAFEAAEIEVRDV